MQGYVNLGDCAVLISAWMLGPLYGGAAAGIGSALADLLSGYAHLCPRHIRHQVSHGCGRRFDPSGHDQKGPLRHAGRSGGGRRGRRGHHGPGLFRLCQPVAGQGLAAAASIPATSSRACSDWWPPRWSTPSSAAAEPWSKFDPSPYADTQIAARQKTSGGNFLCLFVVRFGLLLQPPDHLVHTL